MRNTITSVIAPEVIDPLTIGRARFCARRIHPRRDEGGHEGGGGNAGTGGGSAGGEGGKGGDGGEGVGESGKTFTQADVDRIVQGRYAKYADYDQLKAELDDLRGKNLSDQERAIEEAKGTTRSEVQAEYGERLLQAETRGIAAELGFHSPADAHLYLDRKEIDLTKEIDADSVKKLLEKVAADRPHLIDTGASHIDAGIGHAGSSPRSSPVSTVCRQLSTPTTRRNPSKTGHFTGR